MIVAPAAPAAAVGFDLGLFPAAWHPVLALLAKEDGVTVLAGGDVAASGRVVGRTVAEIRVGGRALLIVDDGVPGARETEEALRAGGRPALALAPKPESCAAVLGALRNS